jgi:hypothetical protein
LRAGSIRILPQLAKPIVGIAEDMIAEGSVEIKASRCRDSDFQLVFSASIRDDLPIMKSRVKCNGCQRCSEDIGWLFEHYQFSFILKCKSKAAFGLVPTDRVASDRIDWPRNKRFKGLLHDKLILWGIFTKYFIHSLNIASSFSK